MHVLPVPGDLPVQRSPLIRRVAAAEPGPLCVEVVSYDFGNTLVRVDRAGSRAVAAATAAALGRAGIVDDPASFLAVWAEERERQFREEVPLGREVDLAQRVARTLARLRGAAAPPREGRWDDADAVLASEPAEVEAALEAYSAAFIATMPPIAGAAEHLVRMHDRGFRLGLLSNWPLATTIDRYVEARGWRRLFDVIVVSQRVGAIKPRPEIFVAAARLLASPPERILHVGDDWAADVVGAIRAGWHAAYLRGHQDDTPLPTSEPGGDERADLVVDRLVEIEPRTVPWRS